MDHGNARSCYEGTPVAPGEPSRTLVQVDYAVGRREKRKGWKETRDEASTVGRLFRCQFRSHASPSSELPRVLIIYDIDNLGVDSCKKVIRQKFYDQAHLKDHRVIDMLVDLGYKDLEDTLLQYKQKSQLMYLLQGEDDLSAKRLTPDSSEDEQFRRWLS